MGVLKSALRLVKEGKLKEFKHHVVRRYRKWRFQKTPLKSIISFENSKNYKHRKEFLESSQITVIVPIFNAPIETEKCIQSVLHHTSGNFKIILIDDASNDPKICDILERFKTHPKIQIEKNLTNLGFVATVNKGFFLAATNDVVILNSDTEVTPRWLLKLKLAAYSDPKIATATPFSNAAGAFSVPTLGVNKDIPAHLDLISMAKLVEDVSASLNPTVPTGNGFCMYIKRAALEDIGIFDVQTFGKGYGEENDFCLRAIQKGWTHVIDDSTYIFHKRSASFSDSSEKRKEVAKVALEKKHPQYPALVRDFLHSEILQNIRNQIEAAMDSYPLDPRFKQKNILIVIHKGSGGASLINAEMMEKLDVRWRVYVLESNARAVILSEVKGEQKNQIHVWQLESQWKPEQFKRSDFEKIYFDVLTRCRIDLVHIRHLFKASFDIVDLCLSMGIPYLVSLHDYYFACPSTNLLDDNLKNCGGVCTPGTAQCHLPSPLLSSLPNLRGFLSTWRSEAQKLLASAECLITTAQDTCLTYQKAFPSVDPKKYKIIPHGHILVDRRIDHISKEILSSDFIKNEPLRIMFPGNLAPHKGSLEIEKFLRSAGKNVEAIFCGTVPDNLKQFGKNIGPYQRDEFPRIVKETKPHFIALFSICAETFSHLLSEAWICGIPVIVGNLGSQKERVIESGAGIVVNLERPENIWAQMNEIVNEENAYQKLVEKSRNVKISSIHAMAHCYEKIYFEVIYKQKPLSVFNLVPLKKRASYIIRIESPLLAAQDELLTLRNYNFRNKDFEWFERDLFFANPDIVLFQRADLSLDNWNRIQNSVMRKKRRFVLDLDDNVFDISPQHPSYDFFKDRIPTLKKQIQECDLLSVSTDPLKKSLLNLSAEKKIQVIPNFLDQEVWLKKRSSNRKLKLQSGLKNQINVIYCGGFTHFEDLNLLKAPFLQAKEILKKNHNIKMELYVVGVTDIRPEDAWYKIIPLPEEGGLPYADYADFLLNEVNADFAIAPLVENAINQSKSSIKYLEYAALGWPAIYSDVGPYKDTVNHKQTGYKVDSNSNDSWTNAFVEFSLNPELRLEIIRKADEEIRSKFLLKNNKSVFKYFWNLQ